MGQMKCAVINDGYTFEGDTDAGDTFPCVKFKFRPFTHMERVTWLDAEREAGESMVKKAEIQAEILKSHVVSWDAQETTPEGKYKKSEITEENMFSLPQDTFQQMVVIILGWEERTAKMREDTKKKRDELSKEVDALEGNSPRV